MRVIRMKSGGLDGLLRRRDVHGLKWRIQVVQRGRTKYKIHNIESKQKRFKRFVLDEVVLDSWLHLEQMDDNTWWIRLGDRMTFVTLDKKGRATVGKWGST